MSQIALSPNASGTGTFTIAAPNSSTNRTLTLPDNTGTILTSATTSNFPANTIIQVVTFSVTGGSSTTSTSFVDTNLTASITPTKSGNKILILVSQYIAVSPSTYSRADINLKLTGAATSDLVTWYYYGTDAADVHQQPVSMQYVYTTTSANSHTFTTQVRKANATSTEANIVYWGGYAVNSVGNSITLLEIAT